MSTPLNHIFDQSACLTRRQLKDYALNSMSMEERYAAEHHLNSCLLCSAAIEGMAVHEHAYAMLDDVNHSFLKEHFVQTSPQVHLNSMALTTTAVKRTKAKGKGQSIVKPSTIAAAILLSIGALWYLEYGKDIKFDTAGTGVGTVTAPGQQQAEQTLAVPYTTGPVEQFNTAKSDAALVVEHGQASGDAPQKQPPVLSVAIGEKQKEKKEVKKPEEKVVNNEKGEETLPVMPENVTTSGTKEERSKPVPVINSNENEEGHEDGNAEKLFQSGRYSAALTSYKKMMSSGDKRTRQDAALMAARCYMNMGKTSDAVQLLETLVNDGSGPQKRTARRMLRALNNESAE